MFRHSQGIHRIANTHTYICYFANELIRFNYQLMTFEYWVVSVCSQGLYSEMVQREKGYNL